MIGLKISTHHDGLERCPPSAGAIDGLLGFSDPCQQHGLQVTYCLQRKETRYIQVFAHLPIQTFRVSSSLRNSMLLLTLAYRDTP